MGRVRRGKEMLLVKVLLLFLAQYEQRKNRFCVYSRKKGLDVWAPGLGEEV